jgi:hypothetical protein
MSGPIVRKYGFPNFDKIFGARPLEHGVEESEQPETSVEETAIAGSKQEPADRKKSPRPRVPKSRQ